MVRFLIVLAQAHAEFRLAELRSLSELEGVPLDDAALEQYDPQSPFWCIDLQCREQARKLVRRAILVKTVYELWGTGKDLASLIESVKNEPADRWAEFANCRYRWDVITFGNTTSWDHQQKVIRSFHFIPLDGKVDLVNPEAEFDVIEDFGLLEGSSGHPASHPYRWFVGFKVCTGNRNSIKTYDLKKRSYLGNTAMDPELSLIMANQALAAPGKLLYDPFVGTGSFLVTCAHFGAMTMGTDIAGRQMRGKDGRSIRTNVAQYNLHGLVLDTLTMDITHHAWRSHGLFDAIVTDPPYGVRAGAKRLGRDKKIAEKRKNVSRPREITSPDYYPPTKPWEMTSVLVFLLSFAAEFLCVGGRLVYWFPTTSEGYKPADVPTHPALELIANCEQPFMGWSRRLITMRKARQWTGEDERERLKTEDEELALEVGHANFREKYFAGFLKSPADKAAKENAAPSPGEGS